MQGVTHQLQGSSPDVDTEDRAIAMLRRAALVLGWESSAEDANTFERLRLMAAAVRDRLRDVGPQLTNAELLELATLQADLDELNQQLREVALRERYQALAGVQAGLARLRGVGSVAAMLDTATAELCRSCGFDRAILFRVLESRMVAVSVHYEGDPAGARHLLEVGQANPARLDQMLLETEMVRRRMPMLVTDAENDPRVYKAIQVTSGSRSYVAAPIMPEGRVIGFLHADRYFHPERTVDEFDRDLIWAFAEGFGYAFERTVLLERLSAQRDEVRAMLASTGALIDEVCDTEIAVGRLDGEDTHASSRVAAQIFTPSSRVDQLLTRREIEVIQLMAAGETNAGIAENLVITEGTVKSHVKHILRKLRAANRAEAVSRFLQISALDG